MRPFAIRQRQARYQCEFLWFRLRDGRIAGLDVIRSDDRGQTSLRCFIFGDGQLGHLVFEGDSRDWSFNPGRQGPLAGSPMLEISRNRVAGRVALGSQPARFHIESKGITSLDFRLDLQAMGRPLGLGGLGLLFAHLTSLDFLTVRIAGHLEINGERLPVDALGSVSQHFGDHLLGKYGYLSNRIGLDSDRLGPRILAASFTGANFRLLGNALEDSVLFYAHTQHLSRFPALRAGWSPERLDASGLTVPLGRRAAVRVRNLLGVRHAYLGVETWTGIGDAVLERRGQPAVALGQTIFEFRGKGY